MRHRFFWPVLVVCLAGIAGGWWAAHRKTAEMRSELMARLEPIAFALPEDNRHALVGDDSEVESESYRRLKHHLVAARAALPGTRFLYWLRHDARTGRLYFLVDSEPSGSEDISRPGEEYPEGLSEPALLRALASARPTFSPPTQDRWGVWVTGYVPRPGPEHGLTDVFGGDVDARAWRRAIATAGIEGAAVALLGIGFPVFTFLAFRSARRRDAERLKHAADVARLALVVSRVPAGVLITDERHTIRWVNEGLQRMLGRTELDLIGSGFPAVLQSPDTEVSTLTEVMGALRGLREFTVEFLAAHAAGPAVWVRLDGRPLPATAGGLPDGYVVVAADIDAQKRAEQALRAEQVLLARVLAHAPEAVMALEPVRGTDEAIIDFSFTLANARLGELSGRDSRSLAGQRLCEVFPTIVAAGAFDQFVSVTSGGGAAEFDVPHGSGETRRWLRVSAVPLGSGCLVSLSDITALKGAEEKFRALFEQSLHPYLILDRAGIVDCNDAFLHLLRLPHRREVLGRHPCDFVPEAAGGDTGAATFVDQQTAAFVQGVSRFHWSLRRSDGVDLPVEVTLTPVRFGARAALLVMFADLSARRMAENRAQASHVRLSLALEASSQVLWEWELDHPAPVIVDGGGDHLGLTTGELEEALQAWRASWQVVRRGREPAAERSFELEHQLRRTSGRWLAIRGRLYDAAERARLTGTIIEVTQRKEAEEMLRLAKEKAEAADAAKGQFLATMSHEIRTPLNGVIGTLQLLAEMELDRVAASHVASTQASAELLLEVLQDILDYTQVESGAADLHPLPCDVAAIARGVVARYAPRAAEQGLVLRLQVGPDVPAQVETDAARITQVLRRLVDNAVKFTPSGEVEVSLRRRPGGSAGRARIEFSVRDTGVGIAPSLRSKLFQPFTQADGSANRRFGGKGLGLALARRVVALLGGELEFDSVQGQGSVFTFALELPVLSEQHRDGPGVPRAWPAEAEGSR